MSSHKTAHKTFSTSVIIAVGAISAIVLMLPGTAAADGLETGVATEYDWVWHDAGSGADLNGSFWRPMPTDGWHRVGHHARQGYGKPNTPTMVVRSDDPSLLAAPTDYQLLWNDSGTGSDADGSIWRPVCPAGFAALGDVAQLGYAKPSAGEVVCVKTSELVRAEIGGFIWNDGGSGGDYDFSAWGIHFTDRYQTIGLFIGVAGYAKPSAGLFYAIE